MKPRLALLDLDGTLVDSAPDFVLAANALRKQYQLPPLPTSSISPTVSNGSFAVTEAALDITRNTEGFEEKRLELLDFYLSFLGQASCIYPSLENTLTTLEENHIDWGIVTNKPIKFAAPLLDMLGLTSRLNCGVVICPDHVTTPKPDPEGLLKACEQLNQDPEACIYIGDHLRDIETAKNAGAISVAAAYGYIEAHDNANHWQAEYVVNTPEALSDLLLSQLL